MTWEFKYSWGEKHSRENLSRGWSGGLSFPAGIFFLTSNCSFQLSRDVDRCRAWQEKVSDSDVVQSTPCCFNSAFPQHCGPQSIEWDLKIRNSYSEIDKYLLPTFLCKKKWLGIWCVYAKYRELLLREDCRLEIMKERTRKHFRKYLKWESGSPTFSACSGFKDSTNSECGWVSLDSLCFRPLIILTVDTVCPAGCGWHSLKVRLVCTGFFFVQQEVVFLLLFFFWYPLMCGQGLSRERSARISEQEKGSTTSD